MTRHMETNTTMDSALQIHVRKILRAIAAADKAKEEAITKIEKAGHRIVDGGGMGEGRWDITDWRTGEVIASGSDGYEEHSAAFERLDPDNRWIHIDRIDEDAPWASYDIPPTDGIPPTLADALLEWLESGSTPYEEIAVVAGWSAAEVERATNGTPCGGVREAWTRQT